MDGGRSKQNAASEARRVLHEAGLPDLGDAEDALSQFMHPDFVKRLINQLHASFPLSAFHLSPRPLPPTAGKMADVAMSVMGIAMFLKLEGLSRTLFTDEPALARAAAELFLALLQHSRSFANWRQDLQNHGEAFALAPVLNANNLFAATVEHVLRWQLGAAANGTRCADRVRFAVQS
eukprot:TRINITY_DN3110_c0_g1_i5.p2 TRINITY_DN3110_c0_g1~~TRINITY_DN3110_c0_g1_i5.p2  ORF type:complete len:178 (+),score=17.40 TRINITY_DN3110_c0_g1_i5:600-1133(+)